MASFFAFLKKTFLALWERLSHISFRSIFIAIGLGFAVLAIDHEPLRAIDDILLKSSHYFVNKPLGAADITVIEVPEAQIQQWQNDIYASGDLLALLSNILNNPANTVGLLLQQPLDLGSSVVDRIMRSSVDSLVVGPPDVSDSDQEDTASLQASALIERHSLLLDYLSHPRVVIGVEDIIFEGQKPLLLGNRALADGVISEGQDTSLLNWLNLDKSVWPNCFACRDIPYSNVSLGRTRIQQFTYIPPDSPRLKPVFRISPTHVLSGFFVQLLRASEQVNPDDNLVWHKDSGVRIGELNLPLSKEGEFISQHLLSTRLNPAIEAVTLNEALARGAFPKITLIARQNSEYSQVFAKGIYSVTHEGVIHTPWWASPVRILLILLATFYLWFAVTRLRPKVMVWISCSFAFSLLLCSQLLLAFKALWVPVGDILIGVFLGHIGLALWWMKKRRIQDIYDHMDTMSIKHARGLLAQGHFEQAFSQLAQCTASESVLHALYDIADAFCDKKDYSQAVNVLADIKRRRRGYKDTEQKLKVLASMLKSADDATSTGVLGKTMVIAPVETERTSIGRYRLKGEIGRGAMGRVFLGFDPRISRKIAIKTLSYSQFKDKNTDDLKTRFFREAEAAGRLNHPAIVSVFDVGEEHDLAFIAMDFAEGNALNSFVSRDNLLPVFEVYRIVCDVAQALHYAHENNVVHRDIKPSNIIYNPAPYQVKVTDFGIARLVDNSQTSTGEILGSPLYMAPEQLKGKRVNHLADIFSLGATFYQLLTGSLPYEGNNLAALTHEVLYGKHKNVRSVRKDLPASAARIINQALQKDPNERYESAAEMALVLKKAIRRDFAQEAKRCNYI